MPPREQANGFVAADAELVARFEALDADQRENVQLPFRRMPERLTMAAFAGMRLDELALHAWDVRVALDLCATIAANSVTVLLERFSGDAGLSLGFLEKAEVHAEPVALDLVGTGRDRHRGTRRRIREDHRGVPWWGRRRTAAVHRAAAPGYTPGTVTISGNTTIDEMRAVFRGF